MEEDRGENEVTEERADEICLYTMHKEGSEDAPRLLINTIGLNVWRKLSTGP